MVPAVETHLNLVVVTGADHDVGNLRGTNRANERRGQTYLHYAECSRFWEQPIANIFYSLVSHCKPLLSWCARLLRQKHRVRALAICHIPRIAGQQLVAVFGKQMSHHVAHLLPRYRHNATRKVRNHGAAAIKTNLITLQGPFRPHIIHFTAAQWLTQTQGPINLLNQIFLIRVHKKYFCDLSPHQSYKPRANQTRLSLPRRSRLTRQFFVAKVSHKVKTTKDTKTPPVIKEIFYFGIFYDGILFLFKILI